MRWFRSHRARLDDFADAIRPELADLPVPAPGGALWERIVASRSSGVRGIVPSISHGRTKRRRALGVLSVAAAALIVALFPRSTRRTSAPNQSPRSEYGILGGVAFAQEARAHGPTLPPIEMTKVGALRPTSLEFSRRLYDSTGRTLDETHSTLVMESAFIEGVPAWRIIAHEPRPGALPAGAVREIEDDTLFLARDDLRLLGNAIHVKPYGRYSRINVAQRFVEDSILGRMTTEGGDSRGVGRPIARQLQGDYAPYVNDRFVPMLLGAVDVRPGWSGSVSVLGWAVRDDDVFMPVELRVVGSERVTVPAGTFDCWRILIRARGRDILYWSRKTDGVGVRLVDETRRGENVIREVKLVRG
ncbi:MAG TPA: hypothetical protein VJ867_13715 [Gemmatimonadaceae bacterium]|nr:hypothetical protein [Gemmatimonadaceae bacterium]